MYDNFVYICKAIIINYTKYKANKTQNSVNILLSNSASDGLLRALVLDQGFFYFRKTHPILDGYFRNVVTFQNHNSRRIIKITKFSCLATVIRLL